MTHDFPGNIRELENAMERAAILCTGPAIGLQHLPDDMLPPAAAASVARANPQNPLCAAQARAIQEVLSQHNGSRRRTAEALGISAVTLWRKMKAFGL
jgi:DNA-binding NtrC family response regulator